MFQILRFDWLLEILTSEPVITAEKEEVPFLISGRTQARQSPLLHFLTTTLQLHINNKLRWRQEYEVP